MEPTQLRFGAPRWAVINIALRRQPTDYWSLFIQGRRDGESWAGCHCRVEYHGLTLGEANDVIGLHLDEMGEWELQFHPEPGEPDMAGLGAHTRAVATEPAGEGVRGRLSLTD